MRATRRRRQTDNFVQLAHALTHLTSRRRADKTSYNTPSGWIIVHWMKLCHSVKWNVTERLLKCDGLAYLYNSVEWMAQLYPVIRYITKGLSMMLEKYCFGFWINFSINKIKIYSVSAHNYFQYLTMWNLENWSFHRGGRGILVFLITAAHVIVGSIRIDLSVNLCNGVWKIVTVTHTNCYIKVIAYIKAALSLKTKKITSPSAMIVRIYVSFNCF